MEKIDQLFNIFETFMENVPNFIEPDIIDNKEDNTITISANFTNPNVRNGFIFISMEIQKDTLKILKTNVEKCFCDDDE